MSLAIGLLGSAVLFLGVFAPFVSVPMIGKQSYIQFSQAPGAVVAVLAVSSAALGVLRKPQFLWIPSLAALGATLFTYFSFKSTFAKVRAEVDRQFAAIDSAFPGSASDTDTMFHNYAQSLVDFRLEWGWSVLVTGAILLGVSALTASMSQPPAQTGFGLEMPR